MLRFFTVKWKHSKSVTFFSRGWDQNTPAAERLLSWQFLPGTNSASIACSAVAAAGKHVRGRLLSLSFSKKFILRSWKRTMSRSLSILFAIGVAGALLGVLVAFAIAPVLKVAVGYPALLACSGVFVQQRSIAEMQASDFAYRPELKLVSFTVDRLGQTVTANFLGGYLASQVAKCVFLSHNPSFVDYRRQVPSIHRMLSW